MVQAICLLFTCRAVKSGIVEAELLGVYAEVLIGKWESSLMYEEKLRLDKTKESYIKVFELSPQQEHEKIASEIQLVKLEIQYRKKCSRYALLPCYGVIPNTRKPLRCNLFQKAILIDRLRLPSRLRHRTGSFL